MKKSFKRLKLLSLFLLCPLLTAFTKLNKYTSDDGYRDFTITYKQESYQNRPDAYVLDVVNNGNQYIKRDYIYAYSSNGDAQILVYNEGVSKNFRYLDSPILIKPGETKKFHASVIHNYTLEGNGLVFSAGAVKAENDYVNVTGPYSFSMKKDEYGKCLNIKCNIKQLKELEKNKNSDMTNTFSYAVSMTIDGEEVCVIGKHYTDSIIQVYLYDSVDFDLENIVVNNIEGFRSVAFTPNKITTSGTSVVLIVFGSSLLVVLLATTVLVTYVFKKRKIVN